MTDKHAGHIVYQGDQQVVHIREIATGRITTLTLDEIMETRTQLEAANLVIRDLTETGERVARERDEHIKMVAYQSKRLFEVDARLDEAVALLGKTLPVIERAIHTTRTSAVRDEMCDLNIEARALIQRIGGAK